MLGREEASDRAISSFIDIHPHYSRFPHRRIWDHDMFLDETPELPCDIIRLIRFRRDLRKAIFLLARPSAFPSAILTLWCANFSRTVFALRTHYSFAYSCSAGIFLPLFFPCHPMSPCLLLGSWRGCGTYSNLLPAFLRRSFRLCLFFLHPKGIWSITPPIGSARA